MNINVMRSIRALRAVVVYTFILGVVYTLVMTGIGQVAFSHKVNGSLIEKNGTVIGSEYLSQPIKGDRYLQGRWEEADLDTFQGHYWAGPTNKAVSYPEYKKTIQERAKKLGLASPVSNELVTGSGSGLDPDITLESALSQAEKIAKARGIDQKTVETVIRHNTNNNFGQPITNVFKVNLELDGIK